MTHTDTDIDTDIDRIGIETTRLNALLVATLILALLALALVLGVA